VDVNHIAFDTKMMTIFSMLFGAGAWFLIPTAADAKGASLRKVYYRRSPSFFLIGLVLPT